MIYQDTQDPTTLLRRKVVNSLSPSADPNAPPVTTPTPPAPPQLGPKAPVAPVTPQLAQPAAPVNTTQPAAPPQLAQPATLPPGVIFDQASNGGKGGYYTYKTDPATGKTIYTPTTDPTAGGTGTGGSTPPPPPPSSGDPRATFQSLTQGLPPTPASLVSLEPKLNAAGIKVLRNAEGVAGKIQLPDGTIVDVIQGAGVGGQAWQWLTGDGASGGSGSGLTMPSNPFQDQVRQMILQRLGQLSQPQDPNAPEISQPVDAARVEVQRAQAQARNALAERLYATGDLNSNSLNQGVQQNIEQGGQALGTLRANLVTSALQNRAQQLQGLLSIAVQTGDTASAQAIQLQLAALNAQLTREGYGVNLAEFGQNQNTDTVNKGLNG